MKYNPKGTLLNNISNYLGLRPFVARTCYLSERPKELEKIWDIQWKLYNKDPYFKPNRKVIEIIQNCFKDMRGRKIIELGAGSGCDIVVLASLGAKAYAVDISKHSLRSISFWEKKYNVRVIKKQADIAKLPFHSNMFDCVYSAGLMEHFTDPLSLLREQIRTIKPGGFLIIDVPQKYTFYTIAKHIRMKRSTHPFGWETEYSKSDLINMAYNLGQSAHFIYGRDLDIIQKLPNLLQPAAKTLYGSVIESSFIAPYTSLCIGIVLKIKKTQSLLTKKNKNINN